MPGTPHKFTERAVRSWLKCKPRTTRECIGRYGCRFMDFMPKSAWRGVDYNSVVYYWLPPRRASKPFEKKLGALDLHSIQPVFEAESLRTTM